MALQYKGVYCIYLFCVVVLVNHSMVASGSPCGRSKEAEVTH